MRPYTGARTARMAQLAAMNANLMADGGVEVRTAWQPNHARFIRKIVASIREALPEHVSKYGV